MSTIGRTACGICLLVWLCSMVAAQEPATIVSPMDDPFGDERPGIYQTPETDVSPGQVPCPAAATPAATSLGDLLFADGRNTPRDNRCGAFQSISFTNAYLPRMGSNGMGWYDAILTSVWGLPFPTKDAPLVITPGIATHWLDGPDSPDIPAQLHDVYSEFRWLPKIGERFRLDVAVEPGYYSDWNGSTARAVRVTGHVSGIYDWTPKFQLVLGAAYLDRPDIEVLPIAGFIWTPNPDELYRLVFPTPKIAWCIGKSRSYIIGTPPNLTKHWERESWFYFAGELGGGTWAIRHSDGSSDLMSYGDWRVFTGLETKSIGLLCGSFVEAGYVFHRLIKLSSTDDYTQVGNTAMVRAGLNY